MRSKGLFLVLAMVATNAAAQKGVQVGVKIIPSWAWFMNDSDEGNATSGRGFGCGANYHWGDGLGVGIDLIWGTETQVFDPGNGEWTFERSVFKLPLLLHFNSPSDEVVPFVGYVGIERVGVRDVAVTGPGGIDPEGVDLVDANGNASVKFRSSEVYHSSDFGAVLGVGPGWNINKHFQLSAIIRAEYMFHDPENKDDGTGKVLWQQRGRTRLVTLGFDFGLQYIIR
ncbi:MAG: outer membrane beta-barrel protein [Flavobacteriales bacterium]